MCFTHTPATTLSLKFRRSDDVDGKNMKKCPRCLEDKPVSEFHKNATNKDGLGYYCRQCSNQRLKEWREKNADLVKSDRLQRKYLLAQEQYDQKLKDQNHVCAICGGVNKSGKALSVDHDHSCCAGIESCGKCIRKLLCMKCNFGIGNFQDNPQLLREAAEYIEDHRQDRKQ